MKTNSQIFKHTQLQVEDVLNTAQYYKDILNFEIIKISENKILLVRNDFKFELVKKTDDLILKNINCQIFDLIWFMPTLDEFYEELMQKKQEIKNKIKAKIVQEIYGQRQIEITDCDGHKLIVSE